MKTGRQQTASAQGRRKLRPARWPATHTSPKDGWSEGQQLVSAHRAGETHENRLPDGAGRVGGHRKMPEETNLINALKVMVVRKYFKVHSPRTF